MGKAGRWLKSFLSGGGKKKERMPDEAMAALPGKEKRWSFRRPVHGENAAAAAELGESGFDLSASESSEFDQKKHAVAVAVATAAAADAAVAAAHAAAAVVRLSSRKMANLPPAIAVEEAAAVRIQATFRGYLARTALCALRGIVKLQALVRGQLVRKQATATLRCMQALLTAQSQLRAQAQRMRVEHHHHHHHKTPPRPRPPSPSPQHPRHRRSYEMDRSCEENAKIVEVDSGGGGDQPARRGGGAAAAGERQFEYQYQYQQNGRCSPAPSSAMMEMMMSPRGYSGHFEDTAPFAAATAHSSPQNAGSASSEMLHMCPSYMANTESSRAKARSQSAPRQRTDALERQPSRRKSGGGGGVGARMQRSSSSSRGGGGATFAWPVVKLDTSSASLKDSECGSTSSVLTAATVYSRTRSLVGFEVRRGTY